MPGIYQYLAPPQAGFFHVFGLFNTGCNWDLCDSPEVHQHLLGSTPELCSGVTRRAVILKESRGQHPIKDSLLRTMTQEQLTAFLANAKGNTSLQEKLKAAADPNAVALIAEEAGLGVSTDDLMKDQSGISDEELERAVGGRRLSPAFCTLGASAAINSCLDGALKNW